MQLLNCILVTFWITIHQLQAYDPAVIIRCGEISLHRDLTSGDWVEDSFSRKLCITKDQLESVTLYCADVYPDYGVTNIVDGDPINIPEVCGSHDCPVTPFMCIREDSAPLLRVPEGCAFSATLKDEGFCLTPSEWKFKTTLLCEKQQQQLGEYFPHMSCGTDLYRQAEYTCCENASKVNIQPSTKSDSMCTLKYESGRCRAAIQRFYYDADEEQCKEFIYGGCGGNANRFETKDECLSACKPDTGPVNCLLPKVVGTCMAALKMYYFDMNTSKCLPFTYGGCQGNENRFYSLEHCESACAEYINTKPDLCYQPKDTGPCEAYSLSFYYDINTSQCQQFFYGGCEGNDNRFSRQNLCNQVCADQKYLEYADLSPPLSFDLSDENSTYLTNRNSETEHAEYRQAQAKLEDHYEKLMGDILDRYAKAQEVYKDLENLKPDVASQFRDTVINNFHKALNSLEESFEKQRAKIHEAHQSAIAQAAKIKKDSVILHLEEVMWTASPKPLKVLNHFKKYIEVQSKELSHQLADYNTLVILNLQLANFKKFSLLTYIKTIKDEVENVVDKIKKLPNVYEEISDDIDLEINDFLSLYSKIKEKLSTNEGLIYGQNELEDSDVELESKTLSEDELEQAFVDSKFTVLNENSQPYAKSMLKDMDWNVGFEEDERVSSSNSYVVKILVGLFGLIGISVIVLGVTIVRFRRSRRQNTTYGLAAVNQEIPFAEVKHLSNMQQTGYENPTYKFFDGR